MINNIVLPNINIFGPSFYNNKLEDKGREEEAYGILWDQFNLIFNQSFTPKEITSLHTQLLLFFDVVRDKQKKVINKQMQQQRNARRNMNPGHRNAIIHELGLMGFVPEAVELAMESTDDNDPEAIINWLEVNHYRINELLTNRVI